MRASVLRTSGIFVSERARVHVLLFALNISRFWKKDNLICHDADVQYIQGTCSVTSFALITRPLCVDDWFRVTLMRL